MISPYKYTIPLYKNGVDKTGLHFKHFQTGSATLFMFDDDFYLITAQHVFESANINELSIMINTGQMVNLDGDKRNYINNKKIDNLDLTVILLTRYVVDAILTTYSFLGTEYIDLNFKYYHGQVYLCLGYAATQNKPKGNIYPIEIFHFETIARKLKRPLIYGLNNVENLLLKYQYKSTVFSSNHIMKLAGPPQLQGMSGGGVWIEYDQQYYLVGVLIQQLHERSLLVATKIFVIERFWK